MKWFEIEKVMMKRDVCVYIYIGYRIFNLSTFWLLTKCVCVSRQSVAVSSKDKCNFPETSTYFHS